MNKGLLQVAVLVCFLLSGLWAAVDGVALEQTEACLITDNICNHLAIFVNWASPVINKNNPMSDAVYRSFCQCILDRSTPILVSCNLLYRRFKETFQYSHEEFNSAWTVYANNSNFRASKYYLLIPKNICVNLADLGFAENLTVCEDSDWVPSDIEEYSNNKDNSGLTFPQETYENFFLEGKSFFSNNGKRWFIYSEGHGRPAELIAGLPPTSFKNFLKFLNDKALFVYYATCYGGGINLVDVYKTITQNGTQNAPFMLAIDAITEDVSLDTRGQNYAKFFKELELVFSQATIKQAITEVDIASRLTLAEHLKAALMAITNESSGQYNNPRIHFPGIKFFKTIIDLEGVDTVGIRDVFLALSKDPENASIVFNEEKNVILLDTSIVAVPVEIQNQETKFLSMMPESSIHYFQTVTCHFEYVDEQSMVAPFFSSSSYLGEKIFVIKKMIFENKEFSNVVIVLKKHRGGDGRAYPYSWLWYNGEDTRYERALYEMSGIVSSTREVLGSSLVPLKDFFKDENRWPVFDTQEATALIPWQEDQAVMKEFVQQELFESDKKAFEKSAEILKLEEKYFVGNAGRKQAARYKRSYQTILQRKKDIWDKQPIIDEKNQLLANKAQVIRALSVASKNIFVSTYFVQQFAVATWEKLLTIAAQNPSVKELIQKKAKNIAEKWYKSISVGVLQLRQLLLKYGIPIEPKIEPTLKDLFEGKSYWAKLRKDLQVIGLTENQGVNAHNFEGRSEREKNTYREKAFSLSIHNRTGIIPLYLAIERGYTEAAIILLKYGADCNFILDYPGYREPFNKQSLFFRVALKQNKQLLEEFLNHPKLSVNSVQKTRELLKTYGNAYSKQIKQLDVWLSMRGINSNSVFDWFFSKFKS